MTPLQYIFVYSFFILGSSMLGGLLPTMIPLSHIRKQMAMSGVSGFMLGVALLHLLPFAYERLDNIRPVAISMLAGVLVMFFLLRIFHVHHHQCEEIDHANEGHSHAGHQHEHAGGMHGHRLSWMGLFFGLALHTLFDGIALSACVVAEHASSKLAGLGIFLAIFCHKPLDALSITSLMQANGWSKSAQILANAVFASMCLFGALLFLFGQSFIGNDLTVLGYALGFSAGFFLCIALGDLLPEVQFHSHDRIKLSAALVAGVMIAIFIESFHTH